MVLTPNETHDVMYTNWKGNTSRRRIVVESHPYFGNTEYHPEPQWLIDATCVDKGEMRTFALKDMRPL